MADFRLRVNYNQYWDVVRNHPPPPPILTSIRENGLNGVYEIGSFRHDAGLITAFVERWRPETHTFHLRFGEATITLEDVYHILGLHTSGLPVIQFFPTTTLDERRDLIGELLGVYPDGHDLQKGGLKIKWLVEHFGSCHRLDMDVDDDHYEREMLFHTRAHLLLILGSLFSNLSGNRMDHHLLYYVRDPTQVGTYSWGSAVLAYLYNNLCSASIGRKTGISGALTLLQVLDQ